MNKFELRESMPLAKGHTEKASDTRNEHWDAE
jgi:hypothetical protein